MGANPAVGANPANASAATCQLDTKALSAAKVGGDVSPNDPPNDPLIGRDVIGQYRIEKKLGAGGMGTVYLAQQTTVQRPAVIKVLRAQLDGGLDLAARFSIEARAASNLNHPNIVTIYNYGQMEDGTLFLAMEYLEGETLEARLARCGKMPADRAVHVASQIARALGEAHAHGVVHRDLKPANVMLVARAGEPDFVKVLDFGIAKLDDAGVTSTGYVVGTPRYMSPEQLLGKPLDGRSDVYSTGVVLYEMLAGVTPFQSASPIGWLRQHVDVEPKPPSALAKGTKIPSPIERVVLRALAKDPADRPPSMDNFALELVAALNAPTEPPWWRRAVRHVARHVVRKFGVWFLAVVIALAGGCRRLFRSGFSGIGALARGIGSGFRRSVRALAVGLTRSVRAIGSGLRRFVIAPPVRIARIALKGARALIATKRRRVLLVITAVIAFAITGIAILFPAAVTAAGQLFAGSKPEIAKVKPFHHAPARSPAHAPSIAPVTRAPAHAPSSAPARAPVRDKKR